MNNIFYKLKRTDNNWYVAFLDEDNNCKIINNDKEALISFYNEHKDSLFIGANNSIEDDILLASIIKNNNLNDPITNEDISKFLPKSLDITQGIVRNNLINLDSIIYSIWEDNNAMPNYYAIDEADIKKELIAKVEIIKSLYDNEERKRFILWKNEIINKYNLPKEAYQASFGRLMEYIIGLDVDKESKFAKGTKFTLDDKLRIELDKKNDPFLNDILKRLKDYYNKIEKRPTIVIDEFLIDFTKDGILVSKKADTVDINNKNLYINIDINSLTSSNIIKDWLSEISKKLDNRKSIKVTPTKNSKFLNIKKIFEDIYSNYKEEKPSLTIGDCHIKFNEQGILGSKQEDFFDTTGKNSYLYIDFNSFGPNILINNNWLADACKYPERYKEIKEKRMELKANKQLEQLFYKDILNAGLDDLTKVYTKDGYNIGLSLSISGIMTMMLLYKNLEKYGIELLECNTDGFIIKCDKTVIKKIIDDVKSFENKLNLSCDADIINKIVHFDERNYIMQFDNGKIKHLGVFGAFQDNPLNYTGITAVDEAIRNYYFMDIPVSETLRNLRNQNNLKAFQILNKQKSNEKPKYIKFDGEFISRPNKVSRLFAVREDKLTNPFYVQSKKGFEEYKVKKGRSIKDGYFHFNVCDKDMLDINDIDLTYYIDKCYKIIKAHPKLNEFNINLNNERRYCFIDLDGTLIEDMSEEMKYSIFIQSVSNILEKSEIDNAYDLFNGRNGNYLIQFLGKCKQYKGYLTIDNFAAFLMSKNLFPNAKDIEVYKRFIAEYQSLEKKYAKDIKVFEESKSVLEKLKNDGYYRFLYSNYDKGVQEAKLEAHDLKNEIDDIYTPNLYYAKSSIKGWKDILTSNNIQDNDLTIMVGNSSSDLVPKTLLIPSIIINQTGRVLPENLIKNGKIMSSLCEILDPHFTEEMIEIKKLKLK